MPNDDLLARLDAPAAPAWRPERKGETLVGTVLALSSRDAGYGDYTIVTVRTDAGEMWSLHAMGTVLAGKIAALAPRPGGTLAVRYDGEGTSKAGMAYKAWAAAYDPPTDAAQRVAAAPPATAPAYPDDEEPF